MNKKYQITKESLEKEYVENLRSAREIAEIVGCGKSNISIYLKKYKLSRIAGYSRKLRGTSSGKNHWFFGKNHSKKTKRKISMNHADISGEKNPNYGKFGSSHPAWKGGKFFLKRLDKKLLQI